MLKSEKKIGFTAGYDVLFPDSSDPVYSAILQYAVQCPDESTCFTWAAVYQNISTILDDFSMEIHRGRKYLTDENNRPILCELEDGVVRKIDLAFLVRKRSPFLEILDDVIGRIVEGGIFVHITKRFIVKKKLESKSDYPPSDDTYYAIGISHLQTAFYLLLLGYILAVVCFVTEIMWHCHRSKGFGRTYAAM